MPLGKKKYFSLDSFSFVTTRINGLRGRLGDFRELGEMRRCYCGGTCVKTKSIECSGKRSKKEKKEQKLKSWE